MKLVNSAVRRPHERLRTATAPPSPEQPQVHHTTSPPWTLLHSRSAQLPPLLTEHRNGCQALIHVTRSRPPPRTQHVTRINTQLDGDAVSCWLMSLRKPLVFEHSLLLSDPHCKSHDPAALIEFLCFRRAAGGVCVRETGEKSPDANEQPRAPRTVPD